MFGISEWDRVMPKLPEMPTANTTNRISLIHCSVKRKPERWRYWCCECLFSSHIDIVYFIIFWSNRRMEKERHSIPKRQEYKIHFHTVIFKRNLFTHIFAVGFLVLELMLMNKRWNTVGNLQFNSILHVIFKSPFHSMLYYITKYHNTKLDQ